MRPTGCSARPATRSSATSAIARRVAQDWPLRAWLDRQRSWLVAEPLPGYAPDLNLVEPLWASLKG